MKKWKLWIAAGVLALALAGCQGSNAGNSSTGTSAQTQETGAGAQGEASGEEKEEAEDKAQNAEGAGEPQDEGESVSAADAEEIALSNPMQEVSGPEALSEIGVSMGIPEGAQAGPCFIISQVVAEVNFTLEDQAYIYRGSATAEDFAGIFEEFEEEVTSIAATDEMAVEGELTIKTTKSGGKLAKWSKNGANYTLYTPAAVEEEDLVALCQELVAKN